VDYASQSRCPSSSGARGLRGGLRYQRHPDLLGHRQRADAVRTLLSDGSRQGRARELPAAYAGYPGERRAAEAILEGAASRRPVG
jgi:hypothetical protein